MTEDPNKIEAPVGDLLPEPQVLRTRLALALLEVRMLKRILKTSEARSRELEKLGVNCSPKIAS